MELLSVLLQAQGGGGMMSIMMIVMLFAIMYFFMIRPQHKKQKEIQKMRETLKIGDRIITSGGVYGKIKEVEDTAFIIEIAEGVKVKVDKASVFAANNESQNLR